MVDLCPKIWNACLLYLICKQFQLLSRVKLFYSKICIASTLYTCSFPKSCISLMKCTLNCPYAWSYDGPGLLSILYIINFNRKYVAISRDTILPILWIRLKTRITPSWTSNKYSWHSYYKICQRVLCDTLCQAH